MLTIQYEKRKTVKSNIKLKFRKITYVENTESGHIVKNGVENCFGANRLWAREHVMRSWCERIRQVF
jgi:hypothetical protein